MDAGPHRATGVMQDFGRDGAQQEASERAVAVRGHHDHIRLVLASLIDDDFRGIAFAKDPASIEVIQRGTKEIIQHRLGSLASVFV
jgi:hypothetical protein